LILQDWNESSVSCILLLEMSALGDKAKGIKIDVDKNQLKGCVGLPLMIYKAGQMIWRQSGELDANTH
jgi:thioredoxin 1